MKRLYVAIALLGAVFFLSLGTSALAGKLDGLYRAAENHHFAPVPKTGQTTPYATGDDGDLQKGIPWPDPRFTDNGDGTVTDKLTSLVWTKASNLFGELDWWAACAACNALSDDTEEDLTDGSQPGDWRLPNMRELYSLIDYGKSDPALPDGHPFVFDMESREYWTSTNLSPMEGFGAWTLIMLDGDNGPTDKVVPNYVWCVRGGGGK